MDDKGTGWMYEGPKSLVNREDYLLGKRLDKNFEMYSDAVIKDKADRIDELTTGRGNSAGDAHKITALGLDIVRSEDPLVLVKLQAEKKRIALMENPMTKLKFQRMLKKMMNEKEKKEKKKKAKERRRTRSSSSDDDEEEERRDRKKSHKRHSRSRSRSPRRKESSSHRDGDRRRRRVSSRSSDDKRRSPKPSSSKHEHDHRASRRRHDSSDDDDRADKSSTHKSHHRDDPTSSKSYDSHIPEHLRSKRDQKEEEEEEEVDRQAGRDSPVDKRYGLVHAKGSSTRKTDPDAPALMMPKAPTAQDFNKRPAAPYRGGARLSKEEMEAKLQSMQDNAKWREETRSSNIKRAKKQDEDEEADQHGGPASFIRSMTSDAVSSLSMEDRLNQQKRKLQRDHGHMDRKWTGK